MTKKQEGSLRVQRTLPNKGRQTDKTMKNPIFERGTLKNKPTKESNPKGLGKGAAQRDF